MDLRAGVRNALVDGIPGGCSEMGLRTGVRNALVDGTSCGRFSGEPSNNPKPRSSLSLSLLSWLSLWLLFDLLSLSSLWMLPVLLWSHQPIMLLLPLWMLSEYSSVVSTVVDTFFIMTDAWHLRVSESLAFCDIQIFFDLGCWFFHSSQICFLSS